MRVEKPCPGCALRLEPREGLPDPLFHSSAECWALYGELAAWTQALGNPAFPHQHAVDAYTAQHVGSGTPPIAAVFALLGLCLAVERGATGRQVQLAHMELARVKRGWPRLIAPAPRFAITVEDVLRVPPGEARLARVREWMECTWKAWAHVHERIRAVGDSVPQRKSRDWT